jgi:glycosyltransferase involved in cell wall biosynthesis
VGTDVKVMVLGIRGLPGVQGGVETHAEHLYARLARLGCSVEAIVRTPFVPKGTTHAGAIRLRRIWSPRRPGAEALLHSVLGVLYAGLRRPDVLHIHAIGPAIVTPLARLLGLRVVVTHHGPDYDRDKWGAFARWVLRTGESLGMRYANARIAISQVIADIIRARCGMDCVVIPNGVTCRASRAGTDQLRAFGLEPGLYALQVSRMVPEKRQLDLIGAFAAASLPGWKLALVGGLGNDDYTRRVRAAAASVPGVVLTDFQTGEALEQLYDHAGGFVLPSSHEGLPIALLEALSHGLPVIASDIPANLEIGLAGSSYFPLGDTQALAVALQGLGAESQHDAAREARRSWVAQRYDWDRIAAQTLEVYRQAWRRR